MSSEKSSTSTRVPRPFLGIHFACCNVYVRIYRNPEASCYVGYCPRCRRKVEIPVGKEGTSARFFTAR